MTPNVHEYEYEYLKNVLEYTSTEYIGPRSGVSAVHMICKFLFT